MQPKDETHQHLPPPGVQFTYPGILTVNTIAEYRVICIDERKESFQIVYIELAIRVHKKDQVFTDCLKPTHQGGSISPVLRVINDAQMWVLCSDLFKNSSGMIFTAVVDDNHLEILHPGSKCLNNTLDGCSNRRLFIVRWHNHR